MAFLTSSILVFAVARAIGSLAEPLHQSVLIEVALVGTFGGAMLFDAHALSRTTWCRVGIQRQTPKGIQHRLGMRRAALAWGVDAGCVLSTYRVSALSWALIIASLVGLTPWWLGVAYGLGFIIPLWCGWLIAYFLRSDESSVKLASALQWHPSIARAFALLASATFLGIFLAVVATGGQLS